MNFIRSHTTLFLISAILILVTKLSVIDVQANHLTTFQSIFADKKNGFTTIFALSQMSKENWSKICNELEDEEDMFAMPQMDFVHLNHWMPSEQNFPLIPVIKCYSSNRNIQKHFMVTYATIKTYWPFFRLIRSSYPYIGIYADVFDAKALPGYNNTIKNLETQIIDFFGSESHEKLARKVLSSILSNDGWSELCRTFLPNYSGHYVFPENNIEMLKTIIFENQKPLVIPVLPCPFDDQFESTFYVAHYRYNVFYKIIHGPQFSAQTDFDYKIFEF